MHIQFDEEVGTAVEDCKDGLSEIDLETKRHRRSFCQFCVHLFHSVTHSRFYLISDRNSTMCDSEN